MMNNNTYSIFRLHFSYETVSEIRNKNCDKTQTKNSLLRDKKNFKLKRKLIETYFLPLVHDMIFVVSPVQVHSSWEGD